MKQAIFSGSWDDNQSWELYRDDKKPEASLCTAVYCLAIIPSSKQVVLTRNQRGWEMLGGHIESGETIEEALRRECLEEGGFTPESYQLFGYRKITAKKPVPHNQRGNNFYPFPHGYIPHFISISSLPLKEPTGMEIIERKAFSFDELPALDMEQTNIIKIMLDFYRSNPGQIRSDWSN